RENSPDAAARSEEIEDALRAQIDSLCDGCVSVPLRGDDGWYLLRRRVPFTALPDPHGYEKNYRRIESELRTV
ncbi:MAG: hypothetical protein RRA94_12830, partial [Bacteroidota bacterium]|nr:hypothetical protein [Bacteroidota bacterium]